MRIIFGLILALYFVNANAAVNGIQSKELLISEAYGQSVFPMKRLPLQTGKKWQVDFSYRANPELLPFMRVMTNGSQSEKVAEISNSYDKVFENHTGLGVTFVQRSYWISMSHNYRNVFYIENPVFSTLNVMSAEDTNLAVGYFKRISKRIQYYIQWNHLMRKYTHESYDSGDFIHNVEVKSFSNVDYKYLSNLSFSTDINIEVSMLELGIYAIPLTNPHESYWVSSVALKSFNYCSLDFSCNFFVRGYPYFAGQFASIHSLIMGSTFSISSKFDVALAVQELRYPAAELKYRTASWSLSIFSYGQSLDGRSKASNQVSGLNLALAF